MTQEHSQRSAWKRNLGIVFGAAAILAVCIAARYVIGSGEAHAETPWQRRPAAAANPAPARVTAPSHTATPSNVIRDPAVRPATAQQRVPAAAGKESSAGDAAEKAAAEKPAVVAMVNRVPISREELGNECLRHYGAEVLESYINKYLIVEECRRRSLGVTREEVDAEVERMSKRFNLSVEQWLKLLQQERGISAIQYASDIIWPTLALRKLAGAQLEVSPEELRAAYDTYYGDTVRCRLIACASREKAEEVRAKAAAQPEAFGDLAKEFSKDPSASLKGLIQPIRRHGTYPALEDAAFGMKDGEISPVLAVADQFVIIRREAAVPGAATVRFDRVAPQLEEIVREKKMRTVSAEIFQKLQTEAKVVNVFNDPVKRKRMPGVAALINNQPIALTDLAEQCIERHGVEVLDGTINRKLIEQACQQRKVTVSEQEIDAEIAHAASLAMPPQSDGTPDIKGWLDTVLGEQHISLEVYRADSVWPSVALRKLAEGDVQVTDDDLKRGYEANFGQRVRCRAIVLNNARRAQEVWEMARKQQTAENFGRLAEQYSVEPSSQALRGEVPPIQRWGGQPQLEAAAFALKPGELSEIVQIGDKYVVLFCEGFTDPVKVTFDEARDEIQRDIYEKKLHLAMAEYFDHLQSTASIDNFLEGTSHAPQKQQAQAAGPGGNLPSLREIGGDQAQRPRVQLGGNSTAPAVR